MLSRVAAVKAPRTHNRRRVTGSSGRRRERRASERQRPSMSRHLFYSAALLLVVMMCCSTCGATPARENDGNSDLRSVQELQWIDLFVPNKTQVLPKGGGTPGTKRDGFVSPSLVSAGGVIAAFARGKINAQYAADGKVIKPISSDVVAGYIDSLWDWSTLVEKVSESTWRAHNVLGTTDGADNRVGDVFNPTITTKDNKVFLLATSYDMLNESGGIWKRDSPDLKLVVGDVTKPTDSEQSGWITWGSPTSLSQTTLKTPKAGLKDFASSGGSGFLMEGGTLVFPLMARNEAEDIYSMIIYSTDSGANWMLSNGTSPAKCSRPRVTEWEGSLLMIVDCEDGQRVYESRDVGATWTGTIGTLPGVWTKSKPTAILDLSFYVEALITASIEGRKVMLYIQRGYASGGEAERALYLWVTDNNRSFYFGPVAVEEVEKWEFVSSLLYSDGNLHLLQRRGDYESSVMSLSRLTEELSTIKSVLSNWAKKDAFFSGLSISTAGLVAVLSDAASGDTWIDDYLCLNATVTKGRKVKDGFQLTEPDSGVMWPVNIPDDKVRHVFLSHNFTLVASVTIEETPSNNTPLLGATLGDTNSPLTMGILYTADKTWVTMFNDKTTESGRWEPKKEYQVALMLQGKKASVYIDGKLLGEEVTLLTGETPLELAGFCFGACEMHNSPMTVKNVFLYNRPLGVDELRMIKKSDGSMHGGVSRALLLLMLLGMWGIAALY
ncbi:putative trans-sialidase, Group II [Trypanosoma cruzi]|uniref:Trans-sialidase, putative n=2 Tax=Trypanosoma cruzi TaxID=5693 RepID=Q4DBD3_TRYCC|nr:trans-sialidase, putative [Trypanosoma cruzi]EAN89836.1 trans-sialidase, putative [Trypanosoma cruzi]PWV16418.1 putative trans-sialidase, Group II [Trypanosoma cruzi]RNC40521.1 trans-sialidase-like protein [Trypanosoma cruzi]|eukprot:XP_811687.1 trans-sialidase [Trypanosoma cruzi strain CL Brener]